MKVPPPQRLAPDSPNQKSITKTTQPGWMVGVQNKKLTKSTRAHEIVENRISTTSTGTPETAPTQFRGPAWRMKAQKPRPKRFRGPNCTESGGIDTVQEAVRGASSGDETVQGACREESGGGASVATPDADHMGSSFGNTVQEAVNDGKDAQLMAWKVAGVVLDVDKLAVDSWMDSPEPPAGADPAVAETSG